MKFTLTLMLLFFITNTFSQTIFSGDAETLNEIWITKPAGKKWYNNNGESVKEDDADATYFREYAVNGDKISIKIGTKTILVQNLHFIKLGDEFLYDGIIEERSQEGIITASGEFKNGIPIKTYQEWYESGWLKTIIPVNGIAKKYSYNYKDSVTTMEEMEGPMKDGLGNGKFFYYSKGEKIAEYTYKMGKQSGYGFQYANGRITQVWHDTYEDAGILVDGLECVKVNGAYLYVDSTGKQIIAQKYSNAENFENGIALVELNGKRFYIDPTGSEVQEAKVEESANILYYKSNWTPLDDYNETSSFQAGTVKGSTKIGGRETTFLYMIAEGLGFGKKGIAFLNKSEVSQLSNAIKEKLNEKVQIIEYKSLYETTLSGFSTNYKFCNCDIGSGDNVFSLLINADGRLFIIHGEENTKKFISFLERVIKTNLSTSPATSKSNNDVKQPVTTKTTTEIKLEKWITEPVAYFRSIGSFKDGLAKVSMGKDWGDAKWGYINKEGKIVVPAKYDEANDFSDGLALVSINNKSGFINTKGKLVVPLKWDYAYSFSEGLAVVGNLDFYGAIDTTGKIVVPLKFKRLNNFNEGIASYEDAKEKWGFIDKTGKQIIELVDKNDCYLCGKFSEGLMLMKQEPPNNKQGFLSKDGKEAISFIYDEANPFSEGLACVAINKKYGYINKEGKIVIPLEYDFAYSFENGLATVKLQESYGVNERYGIIDKNGNIVAPLRYKFIYSFSEGVAGITRNGKKGFINESGKEIIPPKYDEANAAKNGLIAVSLGGSWGYIDLEGNTRISFVFEKAEDFVGGLAEVVYAGKARIIDKSGKYWTGPKK